MRGSARIAAFTVAEVMIALVSSSVILAALLLTTIELQKSLYASERIATAQTAQRRLIDYVGRDLRRAIGISTTTLLNGSGGQRLQGSKVAIDKANALVIKLPGYYQTDLSENPLYDEALPVVSMNNVVDYGSTDGHALAVRVIFRREFIDSEGGWCFVRMEGDEHLIVARDADLLTLEISISGDGREATVDVESTPPGATARVTTHEQILLRNIRTDKE